MRLWVEGLETRDLSLVRGIGSYGRMVVEAVERHGRRHNLLLDKAQPEVVLHPGFTPYGSLRINSKATNILVIHDLIPLKYPRHFPAGIKGSWVLARNKRRLSEYAGFITDSQVVKEDIIRFLGVSENRVEVVYPAAKRIFETGDGHELPDSVTGLLPPRFMLYVGDITWNKNLKRLALAVRRVNLTLVMVGKALVSRQPLKHPWLKDFAEFKKITEGDKRFISLGYLDDGMLVKVYRRATVVVLPSIDEGFGLTWLEASLLGTPVVLSHIPVLREISRDTSVYVDPYSVSSIAGGLEELYYGDKKKICQRQRERAKEFRQEKFAARLSVSLKKLL